MIKRLMATASVALLLSPFLSLANTMNVFAFDGGDGSSGNPYQISTCLQLQDMQSDLTASYELISDIDCSATSGWNSGAGFDPIGYDFSNRFTGTLDGNNFSISDLTINRAGENYNGLIGYANTGVSVSNLTLTNAAVTGQVFTGAILGQTDGGLDMTNVTVSGAVTCVSNWCGGLVGNVQSGGTLSDLHSSANVTGLAYVGGVFGSLQFADNSSTLTDSSSSGTIIGEAGVGGFAGSLNWGVYSRVSATGDVTGDVDNGLDSDRAGGFVGDFCNGVIQHAFATGDVTGHDNLGGLVGYNASCPMTVRNSYARGNVTPSASGNGGSFIGYMTSGTVTNSFATGSVAGQTNGGFIYDANACTSCINNFYDSETTGQSVAGSDTLVGTGKTTAQMKALATYTDTATAGLTSAWDFVGTPNDDAGNTDDWKIDGVTNDGYPFLTSQTLTPLPLTLSPANHQTGVDKTADLVMTFNTPSGASSGYINIYRASDDQLVEAIDVAGGSIAGNGTTTLTINPSSSLAEGTTYYVLIDSTAIRANNGIYYAGISSSSTWRFTTASAPELGSQGTSLAETGASIRLYAVGTVALIAAGACLVTVIVRRTT